MHYPTVTPADAPNDVVYRIEPSLDFPKVPLSIIAISVLNEAVFWGKRKHTKSYTLN